MAQKVDKPFLESILQEPISDYVISEGAKPGDNVAGTLQAIKVTTIKGKTINLVQKSCTDVPELKDFSTRFAIFSIENTMYKMIKPRIEKLMKSHGLSNPNEILLPIPGFYSGNHDPTNPDEDYLCLEDVRPEGYIMPDKFKSLSLPEVNLIMKELSKFHAKTYFWIKVEGEKIFDENEDIKRYRDNHHTQEDPELNHVWGIYMKKQVDNTVFLLNKEKQMELASKIQKNLADKDYMEIGKILKRARRLLPDKTFPCIIHGDCWGNNIMIKYDSSANPVDLKFIDFQQSRRGNIFEDLGYFFFCSTTPEFRKNHLLQALNTYFESFASTLDLLKCPLPLGFTRGSLIDTFFEGRLGYYVYMLMAIPMQLAEPIDIVAAYKANQAKKDEEKKANIVNESSSPPPFDPSQMTPEQMMAMLEQQMEQRSQAYLGQMLISPFAINRLVDLTKEADEAGLIC